MGGTSCRGAPRAAWASLLARYGRALPVPDIAAEMFIVAGDNPERVRSEPAFAKTLRCRPDPRRCRSCARKAGRPIAALAATHPTDRFQFVYRSGPPSGAENSRSSVVP